MARILIIDDDDQIRNMLREVLEREGYEIADAADGQEGARLFGHERADLVITDIIMPNKEGIEVIREFQQDYPGVRIIAMSGGGALDPRLYLHFARELGIRWTLIKPFERKELLRTVREALE